MYNLYPWVKKWGINPHALHDLQLILGMSTVPEARKQPSEFQSESRVQSEKRLEAAKAGHLLMRNNSGACKSEEGRIIRYGLGNDSKKVNKVFKSSDLIGIKRVIIDLSMVGQTIGVFLARECKPEGWIYTGTEREQGQLNFINRVNSLGGDAKFCSGETDL
jgi:hypothetical protein